MIGVGMKVRLVPFWNISIHDDETSLGQKSVIGTVVYINWEHKYFTCEFECGRTTMRESFKFSEAGKTVKLYRKR